VPYNNLIARADVTEQIPVQELDSLLQVAREGSAALRLFTTSRVSTSVTRMPVLAALPVAYFVEGDTGLKQTTEMNWEGVNFNVEEIAAIVPIPENVLDDSSFDIWGEIRPGLGEAIARTLDGAVFFGTNAPTSWPNSIVEGAVAASNIYERGTATAAEGGLAEDINQLMSLVEADGFDVNGFTSTRSLRGLLRSARDTTGQKLMDVSQNEIEGSPVVYSMRGLWPSGNDAAELIAGDFRAGRIAIRQDFTFKLLDQAVITDDSGNIVYNLPQQDMVALRVKFRVAFALANPVTYDNSNDSTRYPFSVLRSPGA
jgi:HK97 family phage major capsid protein